jgi:hypothetical protein
VVKFSGALRSRSDWRGPGGAVLPLVGFRSEAKIAIVRRTWSAAVRTKSLRCRNVLVAWPIVRLLPGALAAGFLSLAIVLFGRSAFRSVRFLCALERFGATHVSVRLVGRRYSEFRPTLWSLTSLSKVIFGFDAPPVRASRRRVR